MGAARKRVEDASALGDIDVRSLFSYCENVDSVDRLAQIPTPFPACQRVTVSILWGAAMDYDQIIDLLRQAASETNAEQRAALLRRLSESPALAALVRERCRRTRLDDPPGH